MAGKGDRPYCGEVDSLPFVQLPLLILVDRKLGNNSKMVYCVLLRFAFHKSFCFPSIGRIASLLNISESTVRRNLHELEERGLIRVRNRVGTSNLYNWSGCLEDVHAKDGFLSQDAIGMLLEVGEKKEVERLKKERSVVIGLLASGDICSSDIPPEIEVEICSDGDEEKGRGSAVGSGSRGPVVPLVRNHDEVMAVANGQEERSAASIKKRLDRRNVLNNDPHYQADKQSAKKKNLIDRARSGRLLGVHDVEEQWRLAAEDLWPGDSSAYSRWGGKECGIMKNLCKRFGAYEVVHAIPVIVHNWEDFATRYDVRRSRPNVTLVAAFADSWIPEALQMDKDPVGDIDDLENAWRCAIEETWPDSRIYTPWDAAERQAMREVSARFGRDETRTSVVKIIRNWVDFCTRYPKVQGYPSVGAIKAYSKSWFPEALHGKIVVDGPRKIAMADGEYSGNSRHKIPGQHNPFTNS